MTEASGAHSGAIAEGPQAAGWPHTPRTCPVHSTSKAVEGGGVGRGATPCTTPPHPPPHPALAHLRHCQGHSASAESLTPPSTGSDQNSSRAPSRLCALGRSPPITISIQPRWLWPGCVCVWRLRSCWAWESGCRPAGCLSFCPGLEPRPGVELLEQWAGALEGPWVPSTTWAPEVGGYRRTPVCPEWAPWALGGSACTWDRPGPFCPSRSLLVPLVPKTQPWSLSPVLWVWGPGRGSAGAGHF